MKNEFEMQADGRTVRHVSGLLIHFRPASEVQGGPPSVGCQTTIAGVEWVGAALNPEDWMADRPSTPETASELAAIMRLAGDFFRTV